MPGFQLVEIESRIKDLLVSQLGVDGEALANGDADRGLLGQGIGLDSVEAMSLASEIESTFEIRFEDDELTPELFATIGSLAAVVAAKRQHAEGG